MKVLVACEFSGIVREAFRKRGHDAWSIDLLPSEIPGHHFQHDIMNGENWWCYGPEMDHYPWDLIIAHPPCTHLASSGARWFKDKKELQEEAIWFFMKMINAPASRVCVENPIGIMSTRHRKPDQIIQPWQFGHGETKATCLWLKNLPLLKPTFIVPEREQRIWRLPPSPDRWKERSRTYQGIAEAMAEQWGRLLEVLDG